MVRRLVALSAVTLAGILLLHAGRRSPTGVARRPFQEFPRRIAEWRGEDDPFDARIVAALAVDDYISRAYRNADGEAVGLYLAYYATQHFGALIHSPKHCLPGSGWEPVRSGRTTVSAGRLGSIAVNEYMVQKGAERQLVLYWYQGRGQAEPSEYWSKVWLVRDALLRGRSDCALVRVTVPVGRDEDAASHRAVRFAGALVPLLGDFIPN